MPAPRVGRPALLLLSVAAGLTDAFAFLALGGIFTANMTGNVVLSALFTHDGYGRVVVGVLATIGCFALGAYLTFRRWPILVREARAALSRALVPAVAVEVLAAALWTLARTGHAGTSWAGWAASWGDVVRVLVVMAGAFVMGTQSAVMKRSAHAGVVTTTYVTGTIVGMMDDLATGGARLGSRVASIAMLVLGALAGCALTRVDERLAPWACVIALVGAALASRRTAGGVRDRLRPASRP